LLRSAHGAEVNLSMMDHRNEDFAQKKATVQCFSGEGHRLGSPTDAVTVPTHQPQQQHQAAAAQESVPSQIIPVDPNSPATSIQIRLTDGSKLVSKFNTNHTVADVRRYITTARPEYSSHTFTLMTTFPNKELTDESLSLAQAGLLNAVLVVKVSK
jgi:UBX domain-containing protein 1